MKKLLLIIFAGILNLNGMEEGKLLDKKEVKIKIGILIPLSERFGGNDHRDIFALGRDIYTYINIDRKNSGSELKQHVIERVVDYMANLSSAEVNELGVGPYLSWFRNDNPTITLVVLKRSGERFLKMPVDAVPLETLTPQQIQDMFKEDSWLSGIQFNIKRPQRGG